MYLIFYKLYWYQHQISSVFKDEILEKPQKGEKGDEVTSSIVSQQTLIQKKIIVSSNI